MENVLDIDTAKPDPARPLAAKIDIHHTPKHGSWLNMAEPTEGR
jgi:hypothetical protein